MASGFCLIVEMTYDFMPSSVVAPGKYRTINVIFLSYLPVFYYISNENNFFVLLS